MSIVDFENESLDLIRGNPAIQAAWIDHEADCVRLLLVEGVISAQAIPGRVCGLPVSVERGPEIHDKRLRLGLVDAAFDEAFRPEFTRCHNEPIPGGVQIQPGNAGWVGTGGVICSAEDDGERFVGLLTNNHVAVVGSGSKGHPQFQPTSRSRRVGRLRRWVPISRRGQNYVDIAVVDVKEGDYHTWSREMAGTGSLDSRRKIAKVWRNAEEGNRAAKSGRTTGYKEGRCIGIGATVRVGYGGFTATFVDQDIYRADSGTMSAPGDSGSCIYDPATMEPLSTLFAGGGNTTIGCPIRHAVRLLGVSFADF